MIVLRDITAPVAWEVLGPACGWLEMIWADVARSERLIGVFADEVALGVFGGVRPTLLATEGYIWLQCLEAIDRHKIGFARASLAVPGMFGKTFTDLIGYSRDPSSIRWLTWLGAHYGPDRGDGWRPFIIRSPHG